MLINSSKFHIFSMLIRFSFGLVLSFCLILSGCSSKPKSANYRQQFLTKITENDSKWFSYQTKPVTNLNKAVERHVNKQLEGKSTRSTRERIEPNKPSRRSSRNRLKTGKFNEMLASYITQSGYCREGYIELDRYETERSFYYWGECNESATDQDKAKWPNNGHFDAEKPD